MRLKTFKNRFQNQLLILFKYAIMVEKKQILFILYEILHTYVYRKSFEGNFYIFNYFQK